MQFAKKMELNLYLITCRTNITITGNTISATGGGGSGWLLNGNSNGLLKTIGTKDNFNLPVIVSNTNIATFGTDGTTTFNSFGTNKYQILMNGVSNDYSNMFRPNNTGGLEFYGGNFYNDGGALWLNGNNFTGQDLGSVQVGLGLPGSSFQVYDYNSQLIFNVNAQSNLFMTNPGTGIIKFAVDGNYGQVQTGNGGATSPGYSFLSDTTTGMSLNSNILNFSVLGNNKINVSTSSATLQPGFSLTSVGANSSVGNATLSSGAITIPTTKAVTGCYILLTYKTLGLTGYGVLSYTIDNGISFTIHSDSPFDSSSVVTWMIINP